MILFPPSFSNFLKNTSFVQISLSPLDILFFVNLQNLLISAEKGCIQFGQKIIIRSVHVPFFMFFLKLNIKIN